MLRAQSYDNKIVYPAGSRAYPGISNLLFSSISRGPNFINLFQGNKFGVVTLPGSVSSGINSIIGPGVIMPGSGTANTPISFSGNPSTNFASSTIAGIISFTAIVATQYIFTNSSNGAGVSLNITSGGVLQWTMFGVVAKSSTITLVAGIPYFVIASQNGATSIDFLATRLDNGATFTSTSSTSGTPNAPNGTYVVGCAPNLTTGNANATVAATAFMSGYYPLSQLKTWSSNPWQFWYSA